MIHTEIICRDTSLGDIWPVDIEHAWHLYNKTPRYDLLTNEAGQEEFSTMEIFYEATNPWKNDNINPLRLYRVLVRPTYVLEPVLCDGGNITKWQPRLGWEKLLAFQPNMQVLLVIYWNSRPTK